MTPDQAHKLFSHLLTLKHRIREVGNETILYTEDDYTANQTIAKLRSQIQDIDQALFAAYRMIESTPPQTLAVRERRTPSIDDLEI